MKRFNLVLLPLVLLSLTPILWFWGRGDVLINGVDTNFPLNPLVWFERRFFVWDAISNAGQDFSSSTAGLFFHLVQVIPFSLGLSLQGTQILSLIFWFSLIVFSSYFFAKTIFPKNLWVQLLFVALYSFNIYLFNTWENVKVANLSMVSAIPLVLATLILLKKQKITRGRAAVLAIAGGVLASGSGLNPSYFLSFLLTIFLFFAAQLLSNLRWENARSVVKNYLFVSAFIIAVNLFWILPTSNFVLNNIRVAGSINDLGFVNWVDSLSANTSLINIMRLQGAWDWYATDDLSGLPLYIPYALNYFTRLPFLVFSFLLAALAVFGLLSARKSSVSLAFAIMFVVGVFLGAGTHEPTGLVFRWLSQNIPFFTFFRSPWYIFTPMLTLSAAGLTGLLFYNLFEVLPKRFNMLVRGGLYLGILILVVGNFFYSYPLVTGKIFRPERGDSFYVEFPDYVFEAGEWLSQNSQGRIIGYPDDEIEQYSWGYRGIESVLGLLVDRETLFSSLNLTNSPAAGLIREFYYNLKRGQLSAVASLADKLNVSLLFEKKDQKSLATPLPQDIGKLPFSEFGDWRFYELPEFLPKIYTAQTLFYGSPYSRGVKALTALDKKEILVNPEDTEVSKIPGLQAGHIVLAENSQKKELEEFLYSPSQLSNRLVNRDLSEVTFSFELISDGGYRPILERYRLEDFGIDLEEMTVEIDGRETIWTVEKITDSYVYFKEMEFSRGTHKVSLRLRNEKLIPGGDFSDNTDFEKGGYGEGEERYEMLEVDSEKFLSILNISKADVSADFSPTSFNPLMPYYIGLRYKQIYGNNASVVVSQGTSNTLVKAQTERLPNYPEWGSFSFYYDPVKTGSSVKISLSAPFTKDPLGTKVFYDDLVVYKVFTNELLLVGEDKQFLSAPEVSFEKVSPVKYKVEVKGVEGPHIIVFSENYSPYWEISQEALHFSTNMYANAWYLENTPESYGLEIRYKPQRVFTLGGFASGGTILAGLAMFLAERRRNAGKV